MKKKSARKIIVENKLVLQLYVSGMSVKSMEAVEKIKKLCDEYLHEAFTLEIIDIYKHPELAAEKQIIFSPSLVKMLPLPKKMLIGNFADSQKVIKGLGLIFKD